MLFARGRDSYRLSIARFMGVNREFVTTVVPAIFSFAMVIFFCFFHLGSESLGSGDESLYALATQGTAHSRHWWQPMWNGKPYFMTAPLKLWLNMMAISIFGESNFSFRVVDALSGCGTFLLLYVFAWQLFRDWRVCILSVIALLGCKKYIFLHGPRQGTLDSVELFFTTFAIYSGWQLVCDLERGSDQTAKKIGWSVCGGMALGLGFMTKSAAVFPALAVIGLYALLSKTTLEILRRGWPYIVLCLIAALLIALPFYVWHCLFSNGACESLISANVKNRVVNGYINQDKLFFYIRRIFVKRELVPPELLLLTLVWLAGNYSQREHRLLLIWISIPLLVFSFIPSRLLWYIASIYPALSIGCGAFVVWVFDSLCGAQNKRPQGFGLAAFYCSVFVFGNGSLLYHFVSNFNELFRSETKIRYDIGASSVLHAQKKDSEVRVLQVGIPKLPYRELPYRNMLQDFTLRDDRNENIQELFAGKNFAYVFSPVSLLPDIVQGYPLKSYFVISPIAGRSSTLVISSDRPSFRTRNFVAAEKAYFFYDDPSPLLYGWAESGKFPQVSYRRNQGLQSAVLVEVDPVMAALGFSLTIHLSFERQAQIEVRLNGAKLGVIERQIGDFQYATFQVSPSELFVGRNPLLFSSVIPSREELKTTDSVFKASSIRTELRVNSHEPNLIQ